MLDLPGGQGSWIVNYNATNITIEVLSALPVELTSFTAKAQNQETILSWTTASELNNRGFEIQRSGNAKDWKKIAWVAGAETSELAQQYTYVDRNPETGINYYRLKQIDLDEQFEYSNLVSVEFREKGNLILIPNPSDHFRQLSYTIVRPSSEVSVSVYNVQNQEIYRERIGTKSKGEHHFNLGGSFPPGIYTVVLLQNEAVSFVKMMVQ